MFGRVKFGTINASQLFFHGSHVFSIFSLSFSISGYMPATKIKSLHSTAGSENIWQFCCQNLFHTIQRSQFQRQMWDQAQNHFKETKPVNTLRPRNSFCCLLVSSHFFYPNFKRPIPSQKWILKQQAPLNIPKIPKAQHENHLPMYEPLPSPRQSHFQNDSEAGNPSGATTVFAGHIHRGPRRDQQLDHGGTACPEPPDAAPSSLGRRGCDADGGAAAAAVEKQGDSHGMFLRVVGQIFLDRS